MAVVVAGGLNVDLPKFRPVKQIFDAQKVDNISLTVQKELTKDSIKSTIPKNAKVAVGVGSRGIANLREIVQVTIEELKSWGAIPFIVPAMGSHGGGTAEGQRNVLREYGITEESMGVTIVNSMDVVKIGSIDEGVPVYLDKAAYHADAIVVINRVKPHTSFKGDYESGLLKMLAIGMGRHTGATALHQRRLSEMPRLLPKMAKVYLEKSPVMFGIGILENAYDQTARIEAIAAHNLIPREKELLVQAKNFLPQIQFSNLDLLVVNEVGKNISGSGMDPNITGRAASKAPQKFNAPTLERIAVLGLTEETEGNACGIGVADVITEKVYKNLDLDAMYANVITSKVMESAKIPMIMPNDKDALMVALKTCYDADLDNPRIVWIKNTLELDKIMVSEALIQEVEEHPNMEVIGEAFECPFDNDGHIQNVWDELTLNK